MSRFLIPGWKFIDRSGPTKQLIVVGYPHTARWDFVLAQATRLRKSRDMLSLLAEPEFRGIRGAAFRAIGCMPVPVDRGLGLVDQVLQILARRTETSLGICPEGGIEWKPEWRTGYWVIGVITKIPVCYVSFDYPQRLVVLHEPVTLTGDPEADLAYARTLYNPTTAMRPQEAGEIAFAPTWRPDLARLAQQREAWVFAKRSTAGN